MCVPMSRDQWMPLVLKSTHAKYWSVSPDSQLCSMYMYMYICTCDMLYMYNYLHLHVHVPVHVHVHLVSLSLPPIM